MGSDLEGVVGDESVATRLVEGEGVCSVVLIQYNLLHRLS